MRHPLQAQHRKNETCFWFITKLFSVQTAEAAARRRQQWRRRRRWLRQQQRQRRLCPRLPFPFKAVTCSFFSSSPSLCSSPPLSLTFLAPSPLPSCPYPHSAPPRKVLLLHFLTLPLCVSALPRRHCSSGSGNGGGSFPLPPSPFEAVTCCSSSNPPPCL